MKAPEVKITVNTCTLMSFQIKVIRQVRNVRVLQYNIKLRKLKVDMIADILVDL